VIDAQGSQVAFSNAIAESDGSILLRVVDCSDGGLGLCSPVYVPRGTQIVVQVMTEDASRVVEHEVKMRVQRSTMVARAPAYYLGASLVDPAQSGSVVRAILATVSTTADTGDSSGAAKGAAA